jgi:PEGA domain
MTAKTLIAAAASLALVNIPSAYAQHRGGGHSGGGGHATARSGASGPARSGGTARQSAPRNYGGSVRTAPRAYSGPRSYGSVAPRSYSYGAPRVLGAQRGVVGGRAVPRSYSTRGYYPRVVGPRGYGYAPYRFYRPYYTFRPHFSIGFGLWAGYPVVYPYYYGYYDPYYSYGYSYPYDYDYPYGYTNVYPSYPAPAYPPDSSGGYPPSAYPPSTNYPPPSSNPQGAPYPSSPTNQNMGGLSFEITPSNAEVIVDGQSMGTVSDFSPTSQPLGLEPGRHHVELRASGYRTMAFDVDIVAGQVIPYQGSLQR